VKGRQRGQAIVLIAIALAVVVGMAALAIDGSRAYALRRDLQAAVDAAALAAADNLQQGGTYISAETAAATIFGTNLRLYATPSCGYAEPPTPPVTCTYADGTVLKQVVSALGPQGSSFALTATRSLPLQFGRILTNGATPQLTATSTGGVNNLLFTPTLAALNQAGCGGAPGTAITINAGGTLSVTGDVVSTGTIAAMSTTQVAGDVYARCQASISNVITTCYPSGAAQPCTSPDVGGAVRQGFRFTDPNYPLPPVAGGSQPSPGSSNNVEPSPGTYAANPSIAAGKCYFLSAGVYQWQSGYTSNGGFVSNELKPPDEASVSDSTATASNQFWNTNGVHCAGAFTWIPSGSGGADVGTWGVELTSVRNDWYAGTSYQRESAPSRCRSISNVKSNQWVNLTITNPPGAQSYNVYTSQYGCSGPFGLVYNLPANGLPGQNNDTSGCGTPGVGTCSLGTTMLTTPAIVLPLVPSPNVFAPPGTSGAYPPDRETSPLQAGLPNQNANRANPPAGDRANENLCMTVGAALSSCPDRITPGAVAFTFPSGVCLNNTNSGDTYIFSGYQYNWIAVYQPPGSSCSTNVLGAAGNSAYVGLVYTPAATINVPSGAGFRSRATGGMIADKITFTGALPSIVGSLAYMPSPPASRLIG
jgi:Flp pilus assembly protein TadG